MMPKSPEIIEIPRISDPRGNLSFIQAGQPLPCAITAAHWLYDVPAGAAPMFHTPDSPELIIAITGALTVHFDGHDSSLPLIRPDRGVFIPAGTGYSLGDFSTNAEALRLTLSKNYEPTEPSLPRLDPHLSSSVDDCRIVDMPVTALRNGSSAEGILEGLQRVFYLYDVPCGAKRGGHSHFATVQVLVAAAGSFDVEVEDGKQRRTFTLKNPAQGLLIPPGVWRVMNNFSSGSVCMVLASEQYSELDYVRDYKEFLEKTSVKRN